MMGGKIRIIICRSANYFGGELFRSVERRREFFRPVIFYSKTVTIKSLNVILSLFIVFLIFYNFQQEFSTSLKLIKWII